MISRAAVYAAIDTERDYQEAKWRGHAHEAESWILFIEHYCDEARKKASTLDFTEPTSKSLYLGDLRKIAALAVAAMEQHGVPRRL